MNNKRIIYLHPAVRTYRKKIFEMLSENLGVEFLFTSQPKKGGNIEKECLEILSDTTMSYKQAKEWQFLPVRGVSWQLLSLIFKKYDVCIFSCVLSVPFLLLSPILTLLGRKVIIFDELWRYPIEVRKYRWIYRYVKFLVRNCVDTVVVAGSKAKSFYEEEFNFPSDKIFVSYNTTIDYKAKCADKNKLKNIKQKVLSITGKPFLLYLGRVVKYKGLDVLIRAMKSITPCYDLVVIGDGDYIDYCHDLTQAKGLEERVHFLGECLAEEACYYYSLADIFILPTRLRLDDAVQTESWGFVINEAISAGCPVVTTDAVGAAFDLVIDDETGMIAKWGDVRDLSERINRLLVEKDLSDFAKKARLNLFEKCHYSENLKAYKKSIESCV